MRIFKDTMFIIGIWFINIVSPQTAGRIMGDWAKGIKRTCKF